MLQFLFFLEYKLRLIKKVSDESYGSVLASSGAGSVMAKTKLI